MRNINAEMVLMDELGYKQQSSENIVHALIEAGFIEEIPLPEPERLAEFAKKWLGGYGTNYARDAFDKAAGWSTDSWKIVMKESGEWDTFDTPSQIKNIFAALVILAKEAGIVL